MYSFICPRLPGDFLCADKVSGFRLKAYRGWRDKLKPQREKPGDACFDTIEKIEKVKLKHFLSSLGRLFLTADYSGLFLFIFPIVSLIHTAFHHLP